MLRVKGLEEVLRAEHAGADAEAAARLAISSRAAEGLAAYISDRFDRMRRWRTSALDQRLVHALRMFNGEYPPDTLQAIRRVGGSEIFARVAAGKCRGAAALLRDMYLSLDRPWEIAATPNPVLPDAAEAAVDVMLSAEIRGAIAAVAESGGQVPLPDAETVRTRREELMKLAREGTRRRAREQAAEATRRLDDLLVEGGFYEAFSEFLFDLTVFPFACIKGPVVRIEPAIRWNSQSPAPGHSVPGAPGPGPRDPRALRPGGPGDGRPSRPERQNVPRMRWERVSPFDMWWTPGVPDVASADIIERVRLVRADLNALIGLPGYDEEAIRSVLDEYGRTGWSIDSVPSEQARADLETRELAAYSHEDGVFDVLFFTGSIQGSVLREHGVGRDQVPDATLDYAVQAQVIGPHVIKVHLMPALTRRHMYFVTSFEKLPGTIVGNGVTDIISDVQDVCNAALRALCNNMGLASGPQVVVNEDMLAPTENVDDLFPWKRWRAVLPQNGLLQTAQKPIEFFQPQHNAPALLAVYEKFTQMADELSAIPRYMTGSERMGGAGRTASGLSMLMDNANKLMKTVAANIDSDVFAPMLRTLYEVVMLTGGSDTLRGDEEIRVKGVNVAVQRLVERTRQLELLQATANPLDMRIMGLRGRGELLRSVSQNIGLDGARLVPTDEELRAMDLAAAVGVPPGHSVPGAAVETGVPPGPGGPGAAVETDAARAQGGRTAGPEAADALRTNVVSARAAPRQ